MTQQTEWAAFTPPAGWGVQSYATPMLPAQEVDSRAISLLFNFAGQPTCIIREILRRAEFWLDAASVLNGDPSSELQKAAAALRAASPESP